MAKIPQHIIDQILGRVSLAQIIGEYTRVVRQGSSDQYTALCPFHNEKSPSFSISDAKGVYYCFGCQARGNTITFLRQHNGLSFREAMEQLAERAGIELPQDEGYDSAADDARKRAEALYFEIMHFALDHYVEALASPAGEAARTYLESRGISEEKAAEFRLGCAPDDWSSLLDAAEARGYAAPYLERAGLAIPRKQGKGHYDRFRNRVMFPILDLSGRCLAFSGRALSPDDKAKYINSPETRFYTKGEHLFGLHAARKAIRQADEIVLVEGNFDVVSLHARGIEQAVAPLGTALTTEQCSLIRRFTPRVVLALDGDRAGKAAANKALLTLLREGIHDVAQVAFEDGSDPDDFIQAHGADALRARIKEAPSMLEVALYRALSEGASSDPAGRRRALLAASELVEAITDPMLRRSTVDEIGRRLQMDRASVEVALRQARAASVDKRQRFEPAPEEAPAKPAPSAPPQRLHSLELALIACLREDTSRLKTVHNYQLPNMLQHRALSSLLGAATSTYLAEGQLDLGASIEASGDEALIAAWYRAEGGGRGFLVETDDASFAGTIRDLLVYGLRRQIKALDAASHDPSRRGDAEAMRAYVARRQSLSRAIDRLTNGGD